MIEFSEMRGPTKIFGLFCEINGQNILFGPSDGLGLRHCPLPVLHRLLQTVQRAQVGQLSNFFLEYFSTTFLMSILKKDVLVATGASDT